MTGRGAGFCVGYAMPGYANPMPRRGFGMGYGSGFGGRGSGGRGRGFRHMYYATGVPGWARFGGRTAPPMNPGGYQAFEPMESEQEILSRQAEALHSELDSIKKRLAEIEQSKTEAKPAAE